MTGTKPKERAPERTLIGKCFHIFDGDGCVQYQGIVRANLGNGNYLVQYFEWFTGAPNTMSIIPLSTMVEPENRRGAGAWQFYEDAEHMNFWLEHHAKQKPMKDEDE